MVLASQRHPATPDDPTREKTRTRPDPSTLKKNKTDMRKKLLSILLIALAGIASVEAQTRKEMSTANMVRANDALESNDLPEAMKYFKAELSDNPKNGYAYVWMASLYHYYNEYGNALAAADKSLQYISKKDKEYLAFAHRVRADIYNSLEDYKKALEDYNAAVKATPSDASAYEHRAEFYFDRKEYALAEKDFRQYISIAPASPYGYMGIGRNEKTQGHYEEAVKWFDKALSLRANDYSLGYSFRAESYIKLGRFDEAASDIVSALAIDGDSKAYYHMQELADSSYISISSRLKAQATKEPNNVYWPYCLGIVSEKTKRYDKAIEYYKKAMELDNDAAVNNRIAQCYRSTGNLSDALTYSNRAVEMDSTNLEYRSGRVAVNYALDDYPAILKDLDYCIQQDTRSSNWYYSRRGWFKSIYGDTEGALEDYTAAITLNTDNAHAYCSRGRLLLGMGEKSAAQKDFLKCLELDTADMSQMSDAFYAFHFLGDDRNAVRLLDTSLAHDGSLYDAACLYSLMGDHGKALDYMKKAFEEGYSSFNHIAHDHDLDNVRDDEAFKRLVVEYKQKLDAAVARHVTEATDYVDKTTLIPFKRRGGVTEVNCSINGLPLYFIFDTGAGDVTISSVEAAFMFKNGYLSQKDVIGRRNYLTASGDVVEGTLINLATIEIGDVSLTNVRASVVKGQNAPLLLGQSVLSRLGKVEIDNAGQTIKITYQEPR